jgi:hypothetical protein
MTELRERVIKVLVGPILAKALDEDVTVLLPASMHFLVERKRAAHFAVNFRIPNFFSKLAGVQVVGKSDVCVVEVLELRPKGCQENENDLPLYYELAFTCNFADILVQLNH